MGKLREEGRGTDHRTRCGSWWEDDWAMRMIRVWDESTSQV